MKNPRNLILPLWLVHVSVFSLLPTVQADVGSTASNQQDSRFLQDDTDPCIVPVADAVFQYGGTTYFKPSYFTACMSSISVNTENMIQHIENINDIHRHNE